jgi:anti-sigma B factor antagonist
MIIERPVIVLQAPGRFIKARAHSFFREIESFLTKDRPRLVLDFSGVNEIDYVGVETLLNCAEEVLKRNGDLKLASVHPGVAHMLELTKVHDLFEIFDIVSDAVESFHRIPVHALPPTESWALDRAMDGGSPM